MTETLLLVDGSSYLYRAFYALPDLKSQDGGPTGALYGVINMLHRLKREVPAQYAACVFDAKGKTFRDELYPQYKAQRPAMPEDLAAQIEPLHEIIRALGWPLLMVEGVEADDVIGTLARQAEAQGINTIISSGDKDLCQLVSPRITVIDTMSNKIYDPAGVLEKFGVPPERVPDWLTLVGDAVDNVPGVAKVGPKTASKWLNEYGSLDALMARAGEIKGVVGENLRQALDWLPRGRELLRVKTDVKLPLSPRDLKWRAQDRKRLIALFERYDLRTWLNELNAGSADSPAASVGGQSAIETKQARCYETVLEAAALERWIERINAAEIVCIDTETTALNPMQAKLVGLALSVEAGAAAYIPLAHRYPGAPHQLPLNEVLARLKPWLEDPAKPKVGQNLKYDWHVLMNHGVELKGIAHDTLLESYVLEAHERHDMDSLAKRHLNLNTLRYEAVCGKGAKQIGFDQVEVARATEYAAEDADIALRLHRTLYPRLEAEPGLSFVYNRIEMPLLPVLARMERTGVLLDCTLLRRHSDFLAQEMAALEEKAQAAAGQPFNLNSPRQLADILFGQLGLPVLKKTPKGAPSTDEAVLEKLALDYPLPRLILNYRALAKLKSTYTDKLPQMVNPATGRVHTTYAQAVAVTGRLASVEPNLQNIPVRTPEGRKIREAFIAAPGFVIVSADYSQIELRIMAHLSGDERLIEAFRQDADIHRVTAAEVLGLALDQVSAEQRRLAKAINFGLIYGMSAYGLASQLGIERTAAQHYIDRYFSRYPGVARYMEKTRAQARACGFVTTLFGRRLNLPEIKSSNPARRQGAERTAINASVQGTAADLIKLAMLAVQDWLDREGLRSRLIMQVHDELVLEVAEDELSRATEQLPKLMCGVAKLAVPLKVDIGAGPNWEAAH